MLKCDSQSAFTVAKILLQSGYITEDDLINTAHNIMSGKIKFGVPHVKSKERRKGQKKEVLNKRRLF